MIVINSIDLRSFLIFAIIFALTHTHTHVQLWFRGVRASKFRHVYGAPSRKENSYTDIRYAHICINNY